MESWPLSPRREAGEAEIEPQIASKPLPQTQPEKESMTGSNYPIEYANKIMSAASHGTALVIIDERGDIRTISTGNVTYDLMAILDRPDQFLSGMRDRGAEPVLLGVYDEISAPRNQVKHQAEGGTVEAIQNRLGEMSPDDLMRDQVLLLVRIPNLRFSWFRRPFGEPDEIELIADSQPVTTALQNSPSGTVNRLLLDAAVSIRSLAL